MNTPATPSRPAAEHVLPTPAVDVPLAGYCVNCHRPAVRLKIFATFRHVVHADGTSCKLAHPVPTPGNTRRRPEPKA